MTILTVVQGLKRGWYTLMSEIYVSRKFHDFCKWTLNSGNLMVTKKNFYWFAKINSHGKQFSNFFSNFFAPYNIKIGFLRHFTSIFVGENPISRKLIPTEIIFADSRNLYIPFHKWLDSQKFLDAKFSNIKGIIRWFLIFGLEIPSMALRRFL